MYQKIKWYERFQSKNGKMVLHRAPQKYELRCVPFMHHDYISSFIQCLTVMFGGVVFSAYGRRLFTGKLSSIMSLQL